MYRRASLSHTASYKWALCAVRLRAHTTLDRNEPAGGVWVSSSLGEITVTIFMGRKLLEANLEVSLLQKVFARVLLSQPVHAAWANDSIEQPM